MKGISLDNIREYREAMRRDPSVPALTSAMARTPMEDLAFVPTAAARLSGDFEVEIKTHGITAQEKSGRCWLFAALNYLREEVIKKTGLEDFVLSGNYLSFYDKLEKANNVLTMAVTYADLPYSDRMTEYIFRGFGDGGYWDMAADLVAKYGAAPKSAMPESYQSEHTDTFMKKYLALVRKDAAELREMARKGLDTDARKNEMMAEIYKTLCIVFGEPVETFDFDYRSPDGVYHKNRGITPKEFYDKFIGVDLREFATITHHPTPGLPMDHHYAFHYIGSMADRNVDNLNLTMDELEELCIRQLKAGMPVWFGCDAGAFGDRKAGVWDPASLNFEKILGGVDLHLEKGARLRAQMSYATHAMILVGVNFDENGVPNRWKIENSWGGEVGKKGYFVCSEAYFREYVYEAIIHRSFLDDRQRSLLDTEPEVIPAWESDFR